MEKEVWLKISGVSGILTPILAFTRISLAIASYPQFSWTDNALSDLGVVGDVTSVLFNGGLIISGILTLLFALGLFMFLRNKMLGRIGAFLLVLDALSLSAIGVFPENVKPTHYYASVAFFMFFPLAMFFIATALFQMGKLKMGLFTFLAAIFAVVVWVIQFTIKFGRGVAIPETLTSLSASAWVMFLGYKMLKQASHPTISTTDIQLYEKISNYLVVSSKPLMSA